MNCNIFISCYHSYSITPEGEVYSKYLDTYLKKYVRNGYYEVQFSFGTGKERLEQWLRVDWLVAMHYLSNPNNYAYIKHLDGNLLNNNVTNLKWMPYCTKEKVAEIKGYRGKYIITDTGKVFNNYTGQLMKTRLIHGYPHVGLRVFDGKESKQKLFKVHRLVAEYFIPNPNNYPIVNHKDGDKLNADIQNLEWTTLKGNTDHAVQTGLIKTSWTKELGAVAITLIEDYKWSSTEVAKLLGKSKSSVLYLYQKGYHNLGLTTNNSFVKKTSKYKKALDIPKYYKQYITNLLKDNTVLNKENKSSLQCND
jgi:hypothetical protein